MDIENSTSISGIIDECFSEVEAAVSGLVIPHGVPINERFAKLFTFSSSNRINELPND